MTHSRGCRMAIWPVPRPVRIGVAIHTTMHRLAKVNDRLVTSDVRRARERLVNLGRWYAARPRGASHDEIADIIAADRDLAQVAETARLDLVVDVDKRAGPFESRLLSALLEVPRERFVRPTDIAESTTDTPLLLDDEGLATISAPHAYLLSFRVLDLQPGERIAELGAGSGYGAALASRVVGPEGSVLTFEIDDFLARRARHLLADYPNVELVQGDAGEMVRRWAGCERVTVTFAVNRIPDAWLAALPEGGRLVAPVGAEAGQRLVRVDRVQGQLVWSDHGAVRYVRNRGREAQMDEPSS
jgi:protein-L-isoaspartate(D-aspartate) O-methyltransferase